LRRQGFISTEIVRGKPRYKLRFRREERKQTVRYIRPADVECIKTELVRLQADRRAARNLRQVTRTGRAALRNVKTQLAPLVAELGLRFHGRAIRRPRKLSVHGSDL
jgi:hypothetical protein